VTQVASCSRTKSSRAPVGSGEEETPGENAKINVTPCAVCGEPSTRRRYDGLDPDQQYDPSTGRYWSADLAHYPALCAAH
jgi:hypothetical protein